MDATERAVKLVMGVEPIILSGVTVYVLGDGKRPLSAAALCLHMPSSWKYVSIDPLLEVDGVDLGEEYGDRFRLFPGFSQDFDLSCTCLPRSSTMDSTSNQEPPLAIVVALHSHAPLSEFWLRLGGRKVAVTMECCAQYSELHSAGEVPVMEFEDFEVYSPKRTVKIYHASVPPEMRESNRLSHPAVPAVNKRLSSTMINDESVC